MEEDQEVEIVMNKKDDDDRPELKPRKPVLDTDDLLTGDMRTATGVEMRVLLPLWRPSIS